MITMEFEELQKIWDTQNNEPLYAINEKALHNRILSKKKQGLHITNISELLSIIVNAGAGCFIFGVNFFKHSGNMFMYILSAWMFICALYLLVSRLRRVKANQRFDRSISGDLNNAISVATYQVRLSQMMRWNILPTGTLITLGVWNGGKSVWLAAGMLLFFVLTYYASAWEHNIYKRKKRELEMLKSKLDNEG
jgi:Flp pilus assembly protein TadB